ncbi:AlpA family phage regulatory protein [Burkholderia sp. BE17]|nr:AlpA family phage regulatory protein [Burkholderia sp. BE17]
MPVAVREPEVKQPTTLATRRVKSAVVDLTEDDRDSTGCCANSGRLPQPAQGAEVRKVGKVARLPRVIELTGLGRSSIYNRMDSRSRYYDPTFPRCFSLSTSETGAVGWDEEQVRAWVAAQAANSRG